jgi:hypothetical protein
MAFSPKIAYDGDDDFSRAVESHALDVTMNPVLVVNDDSFLWKRLKTMLDNMIIVLIGFKAYGDFKLAVLSVAIHATLIRMEFIKFRIYR